MSAVDVLAGRAFPGRKIVIIGGGSVGCETADYLAPLINDRFPRNRDVTIIEMAQEVMMNESGPGRSLLVQRMIKKGVKILVNTKVAAVEKDKIKYLQNGVEGVIDDADTLIFACGYQTDSAFENMLKELKMSYHLIGDAHQVGNIKDAIGEAYRLARDI